MTQKKANFLKCLENNPLAQQYLCDRPLRFCESVLHFQSLCSRASKTGGILLFCPSLQSSWGKILQRFKCKLRLEQQQCSVSKTENRSKNLTNGRISLKSSYYGRELLLKLRWSIFCKSASLVSQLFGREIAWGQNLSLHILPCLAFSAKSLASGNSPSLGFSQIKWLGGMLIVVVGVHLEQG